MNNKIIHKKVKNQYKNDIKIFILFLIASLLILFLTLKINKDFNYYETINYNDNNLIVDLPTYEEDNNFYLLSLFKSHKFEYYFGIGGLFAISLIMLFNLIDRYEELRRFNNK